MFNPMNLTKWVEENRHLLKPPVGNKQIETPGCDTIVMIVGGPNARNDFHIQPTEEFFYQVEGDITLRIMHPDTHEPHDIVIREGELYMLPRGVPHSPQRPADTIGLVIEQKRPDAPQDALRWYCDGCHRVVYEATFALANIATDLKQIMETFWGDERLRTCEACGDVVKHPGPAQAPAPASH